MERLQQIKLYYVVIKIQKWYRFYRKLKKWKKKWLHLHATQNEKFRCEFNLFIIFSSSNEAKIKNSKPRVVNHDEKYMAATSIQRIYRGYSDRKKYRHFWVCVLRIQCWIRRYFARKKLLKYRDFISLRQYDYMNCYF